MLPNFLFQNYFYEIIINPSILRCYAIVYPMKAKSVCTVKKSIKVVIAVWFMAFVLASPTLIVQEHLEIGMIQTAFWCLRGGGADYGSKLPSWLWPAHEVYFTIIVLVIPGHIPKYCPLF